MLVIIWAKICGFTALNRPNIILLNVLVPITNVLVPIANVLVPIARVFVPIANVLVPIVNTIQIQYIQLLFATRSKRLLEAAMIVFKLFYFFLMTELSRLKKFSLWKLKECFELLTTSMYCYANLSKSLIYYFPWCLFHTFRTATERSHFIDNNMLKIVFTQFTRQINYWLKLCRGI